MFLLKILISSAESHSKFVRSGQNQMDHLITILRAAGEPNRLRILALCAAGDITVSELTRILGQSQPSVSRHLKLLCDAGLLERHQEGSWAYFHLPTIGENARVARFLMEQIPNDDPLVQRDRRLFDETKQDRAANADAYFRENAARWDRPICHPLPAGFGPVLPSLRRILSAVIPLISSRSIR